MRLNERRRVIVNLSGIIMNSHANIDSATIMSFYDVQRLRLEKKRVLGK